MKLIRDKKIQLVKANLKDNTFKIYPLFYPESPFGKLGRYLYSPDLTLSVACVEEKHSIFNIKDPKKCLCVNKDGLLFIKGIYIFKRHELTIKK